MSYSILVLKTTLKT